MLVPWGLAFPPKLGDRWVVTGKGGGGMEPLRPGFTIFGSIIGQGLCGKKPSLVVGPEDGQETCHHHLEGDALWKHVWES